MKIGDSPKPASVRSADKRTQKAEASSSRAGAVSDEIVMLGVPETELTPRVRDALTSLLTEVRKLRTELNDTRSRISDLELLADRDPLVDLFNRRAFVRELNRVIAMIERYDMRASLVFADLNDLKIINDSKGHGAGDAALTHVAAVLSENVRQTDIVARLGGDEFGILLTQADNDIATAKADNLAHLVSEQPVVWKKANFTVKISCGVVEIGKGQSVEQTIEQADAAMYQAKSKK